MFEKLNTPEEIFSFKLGAALTMEKEILGALPKLQQATNRDEVRGLLEQHEEETRRHVANIEESFRLLGEEADDSPCPAIKAILKEGEATLKKIDDSIVDAGIFSGVIEIEHHGIAVYEVLVANAQARGADDVAALLSQNLEDDTRALEQVKALAERIATGEGYAVTAG